MLWQGRPESTNVLHGNLPHVQDKSRKQRSHEDNNLLSMLKLGDNTGYNAMASTGPLFKGYVDPETADKGPKTAPGAMFRGQQLAADPTPAQPQDGGNMLAGAGQFTTDLLRRINDKATFGLWDKFTNATGLDPGAADKTAAVSKNNPAASIVGDTLGYMAPTGGIQKAVVEALPSLAGAGWRAAIGSGMLTGGATSAIDDIAHGHTPDPTKMAIDTVAGGAGNAAMKGLFGILSPEARVRNAGQDLTDAEKQAAYDFSKDSSGRGIPLTNAEAINATVPSKSGGPMAAYDTAVNSPAGSQVGHSFDEGRKPLIEEAGRNIVDQIGPGADPFDTSLIAKKALKDQSDIVGASAKPWYDKVKGDIIPAAVLPDTAGTKAAARTVLKTPRIMEDMRLQNGGKLPNKRSVMFLDATKKELDNAVTANSGGSQPRPNLAGLLAQDAGDMTAGIDAYSPDYATARGIAGQGAQAGKKLQAGPLGVIADNPTTGAQSGSLFGVNTDVDRGMAINTADRLNAATATPGILPTPIPGTPDMLSGYPGTPGTNPARGILANHLDTAVSTNPLNFGEKALPTPQSEAVAKHVLGNDFPEVVKTLNAARAVKGDGVKPFANDQRSGPWGEAWNTIRNMGKGDVARLMQDPKWIKLMGTVAPEQRNGYTLLQSIIQAASNGSHKRQ